MHLITRIIERWAAVDALAAPGATNHATHGSSAPALSDNIPGTIRQSAAPLFPSRIRCRDQGDQVR